MSATDTLAETAAAPSGYVPKETLVWGEIPVSSLEAGMAFYSAVLGGVFDLMDMGPDKTAVLRTDPPMAGTSVHLYQGKPGIDGRGPTLHLTVADTAEAAATRAEAAGGKRLYGPIEIPYGQFIYIEDPDGNSIGLFEPKGAAEQG